MSFLKEANISKVYTLSMIAILILLIVSLAGFLVNFEISEYQEDVEHTKKSFMENQKDKLKEEMERLFDYIEFEKAKTESILKRDIKEEIYKVHSMMSNIYKKNRDRYSDSELKKLLLESLRDVRFNDGRGYFFVDSMQGEILLMPIQPEYEGKSALNNRDLDGKYIMRSFIQIVKEAKEGFHKYSWYKPKDKTKHYTKIAFVKHFEPFNWIIGTGEYLADVESDIKRKILDRIDEIRFGEDGYFSVTNVNGDIVLLPTAKEFEGRNLLNFKGKDSEIVRDIGYKLIAKANDGGGFYEYDWYKPSTNELEKKLAYTREFKDWNWIINVGIYLDDLEDILEKKEIESKEEIKEEITFILFLFAIGLIISVIESLFFAKTIGRILNKYRYKIESYNRKLESKVASEIEKRRKNEQILIQQSKLAEMGEMIGSIAHQWRQPLNILALNAQDLEDAYEYKEIDDRYIDNYIEKSMGQINYMSKTIDDFRNFFKPEKEKKLFSIKKSILSAKTLIDAQFKNRNIDIDIKGSNLLTNGYSNEFSQVIVNILNNSKDAILLYRERLSEPKYRGVIDILIEEYKEKIKISIKDNAGGLSSDIIDRIFEPYFTTKNQSQGTGIGLYMAKMIIENNMQGSIYVNREIKSGAEFVILLKLEKIQ